MKKPFVLGLVLSLVLFLSVVVAIALGSSHLQMRDIMGVFEYKITHAEMFLQYQDGAIHDIVWLIRAPRVILAVIVGGGLAVCGLVMQAIVKNPLADPYILGVSSGASLGATLAIMLGIGIRFGTYFVGMMAFYGAMGASILVLMVAHAKSYPTSMKLVLSGMAVSSIFSSFSSFIVFIANDKEGIQTITFWLMGSLAGAKWHTLGIVCIVVLIGSLISFFGYRTLDLMLLGDAVAITLGKNLKGARIFFMMISAVMIGFIVFVSGMIGFVGLIIPHLTRMMVGTRHKVTIPIAFLCGSIFMVWADVASRIIIPYTELPIGILIAMIGAPFFVYMLVTKEYRYGGDH